MDWQGIGLQVLRVHGHVADQEDETAMILEPIGHHRTEREPWLYSRQRGQAAPDEGYHPFESRVRPPARGSLPQQADDSFAKEVLFPFWRKSFVPDRSNISVPVAGGNEGSPIKRMDAPV